jgi:hypothetical protein
LRGASSTQLFASTATLGMRPLVDVSAAGRVSDCAWRVSALGSAQVQV